MYKVFIDTNIILDMLQQSRPYHLEAKDVFFYLDKHAFTGFYSESVVTTLAYVLRKHFGTDQLNTVLDQLNTHILLLSCTNQFVQNAVKKKAKDFEDALLYEIALQHKLDLFLTSNVADFKGITLTGLPVITAKDFFKTAKAVFIEINH